MSLEDGETIVGMTEFNGHLYVATTKRVFFQNGSGDFEPLRFLAVPVELTTAEAAPEDEAPKTTDWKAARNLV